MCVRYYEILMWWDSKNPQELDGRTTTSSLPMALKNAKREAREYGRVEVNLIHESGSPGDIVSCELIASWENGKRVC